ncbi:MAG: hypothetical protein AB1468_06125, partial [Candidatus Micrarchaeota archaeon]
GGWVHSPVGIGAYEVRDGDVIGFKYIDWNVNPPPQPPLYSFGSVCQPQTGQESVGWIKHFAVNTSGNCTNQPVNISVTRSTGEVVWEPSVTWDLRVIMGARIKVMRQELWWVVEDVVYSDSRGRAEFTPRSPGAYEIEVEKSEFVPMSKRLYIWDCEEKNRVAEKTVVAERGAIAGETAPAVEKTGREGGGESVWVGFWIKVIRR